MAQHAKIMRATAADFPAVKRLVSEAIRDVYAHVLIENYLDSDENWEKAWIAKRDGSIVAVMMSANKWIDDLWVHRAERSKGLGSTLLSKGEEEIAARGHSQARLRLVAENDRALKFYLAKNWAVKREFLHEKHGFPMLELTKTVKSI
jgi:GNAT superfamily N-acetyltransferase